MATCKVPVINTLEEKSINCNSPKNNINEKLKFVQGIYPSKESKNDLLIVNDNGITIIVTKSKTLSILAIVGITIGGIFLVGLIFYLIKYFFKKKENYNNVNFSDDDRLEGKRGTNVENSKDVIFK